jgi:prepilin-type N-terminal cleavage/methylation domain-containing protein
MNYVNSNISSSKGFTLIEIIATIIIMGILSAFFIHFMGTALDNSWKSVELVAGEAEAEGKLEKIIAYYTSKINDDSLFNDALSSVVEEFRGDDTITMICIEFNVSSGAGAEEVIKEDIDECPVGYRNLKVTIKPPGNNLTTILTQSRTDSTDPKVGY